MKMKKGAALLLVSAAMVSLAECRLLPAFLLIIFRRMDWMKKQDLRWKLPCLIPALL